MITDTIIDILLTPIYLIFSLFNFPTVDSLTIPAEVFEGIKGYISNVAYFIPINKLIAPLGILIALDSFIIIWALVLRIKSFIPTMGR